MSTVNYGRAWLSFLMIRYKNYWPGFNPDEHLFHEILKTIGSPVEVLGPFETRSKAMRSLERIRILMGIQQKSDFFITGENKRPQFGFSKKHIGFWRRYKNRRDIFRFPYWMWHLNWPELRVVPKYNRYGMPLSIDRLMKPICESYDRAQLESRLNRAVIFSMHLREPRKKLYKLTNHAVGCDGFGGAFGKDNRSNPKMPIMEMYRYSLCPENSVGDGYITEKVPESFHAGCIPITWSHPDDLQEDFNPNAVVNLYGLDDDHVTELLEEVSQAGDYYRRLIREPLLLRRPSLSPLVDFITKQ